MHVQIVNADITDRFDRYFGKYGSFLSESDIVSNQTRAVC